MMVEPSGMGLVHLREILVLSTCEDTARRCDYEPRRGLSPECDHVSTLILDFPAARTVRNKSVLF